MWPGNGSGLFYKFNFKGIITGGSSQQNNDNPVTLLRTGCVLDLLTATDRWHWTRTFDCRSINFTLTEQSTNV